MRKKCKEILEIFGEYKKAVIDIGEKIAAGQDSGSMEWFFYKEDYDEITPEMVEIFGDYDNASICIEWGLNIDNEAKYYKTETEFRGLCKNLITGTYDVLFQTFISERLCSDKTIEKAEQLNIFNSKYYCYDKSDMKIQKREVETYVTEWI